MTSDRIKLTLRIVIPLLSLLVFQGCIQDELPNSEADILECVVPDMPENIISGGKVTKPPLGGHSVKIWVVPGSEIGVFSPEFILSKGATIDPESGTSLDFSEGPQTYTVTSENGKYTKKYSVEINFAYSLQEGEKTLFSFEHYDEKPDIETTKYPFYNVFYELNPNGGGKQYVWSSGNPGFALTNTRVSADKYPTFSYEHGKEKRGVKLVTRSTGKLGALVGMPLAAGNLFLGVFNVSSAMSDALGATQFGIRSGSQEPDTLKVWYKYQPGPDYKTKQGVILKDKIDKPSIYSVLYDPEIDESGEAILLNGDNVLSASNIIAVAELSDEDIIYGTDIESDPYTQVAIPFVKRKEIDPNKLKNREYFITVVFAASDKGKYFEGAENSVLCVDEVELIWK
ncbi:PCMD domain-containing protein [Bacteroidales bacterium OttesenSCG-928-A17]|nr:PCMD domain-containing protein [Bacteroidales bacterium OttesenSCG-928-A17]